MQHGFCIFVLQNNSIMATIVKKQTKTALAKPATKKEAQEIKLTKKQREFINLQREASRVGGELYRAGKINPYE